MGAVPDQEEDRHAPPLPRRLAVSIYKSEGPLTCCIIGKLLRRRLHEIARRADQRTANAAVERNLGATHGIDDDPRRIRRVPHFDFQLYVQRDEAESRAFHADISEFSIRQPGYIITRGDMDVLGGQWDFQLAKNGPSF